MIITDVLVHKYYWIPATCSVIPGQSSMLQITQSIQYTNVHFVPKEDIGLNSSNYCLQTRFQILGCFDAEMLLLLGYL